MKTFYVKLLAFVLRLLRISTQVEAQSILANSTPGGLTIRNNPNGSGNRVSLGYNQFKQVILSWMGLLLLLLSISVNAQVVSDGNGVYSAPGNGTISSFTVPANSNRVIIGCMTSLSASSMTFDGNPMTIIASAENGGLYTTAFYYALGTSATPTTGDIVGTPAHPAFTYVGASSFYNVDQTTPIDVANAQTDVLSSGSASINVSSKVNDLVCDCLGSYDGGFGNYSATAGTNQTVIYNIPPGTGTGNDAKMGSSYKTGSSTVQMSWSTTIPNTGGNLIGFNINQFSTYDVTATQTNVSCNGGSDGSVEITVTDGTAPYTVDGVQYNTNPFTISGLSAGAYVYNVTDANGSVDIVSGTITEPAAFYLSVDNTTNVSCNGGSDGSITLNAGFSFTEDFESGNLNNWTQGTGATFALNTTTVPTNGGTYSLEMHSGVLNTTLVGLQHQFGQSVAPITISFDVSSDMTSAASGTGMVLSFGPSVFNANDLLTLAIAPSGNQQFQMYSGGSTTGSTVAYNTGQWYNMEFTNFDFTNNTVEWYIDGALQATLSIAASVDDFDQINIRNYADLPEKTYVDNINVQSASGSSLTYDWENTANPGTSIGTGSSISNLSAGTYIVTGTDANGCTADTTISVTEPTAITFTAVESACSNGADGEITVTASGGTAPLEYSSDNGVTFQSSNVLTGLAVGSHDIVVKDANGCTTAAQSVSVASCFTAAVSNTTNVSCNAGSDGSVEVTVTGGATPYSDGTNSYTTNPFTITGLSAGAFAFTITDGNGATSSISGTITEPTAVSLSLDNTIDVSCPGGSDGVLDVSATGGTTSGSGGGAVAAVYISEADANSPDFIEITSNGTIDVTGYQVVVSSSYSAINSANTTTWQLSGTMTANTPMHREDVTGANYWGNNIFWSSGNNSWAIIIDPAGNIVDAVFWGWSATDIAGFTTTVGGLTVTNNGAWTGDGVSASCTNSFTRTGTTDTNTDADWTCIADSKGVDNLVIPSVLTGGYTYAWSSGQMTDSIVGLTDGSYTVTVTDLNGCTDIQTYTVGTTPDVTLPTVVTQDITVQLDASGNATITEAQIDNGSTDNCTAASGLTYALDVTTFSCADIGTNTVTLTVTDGSNNSASNTATVTVQDMVAPTVVTQNTTVQLDATTGSATITTMDIDNGSSDNCTAAGNLTMTLSNTSFSCADVGTNSVMLYVTDANGNIDSAMATVTVLNHIQNFVLGDSTLCSGTTSFDLSVLEPSAYTGGVWTNLSGIIVTNNIIAPVNNSPYTYTYTDANGCSANATKLIDVASITAVTTQNAVVYLDANGQATIDESAINTTVANDCNTDFTYSTDVEQFDCNNLGNNTVTLIGTDANGNTTSATATVDVQDTISPMLMTQDIEVTLDANGDASITADDLIASMSDNCSIVSTSADKTDFVIADFGDNIVTVTVTDAAGNTTSMTAIVTVYFAVNTTGIEKEDIQITAYPNPARDMIRLQMTNINAPTVQATLLDVNGRIINTYQLQTQDARMDISNLPQGNYFIRIQTEEMIKTVKFVKQ